MYHFLLAFDVRRYKYLWIKLFSVWCKKLKHFWYLYKIICLTKEDTNILEFKYDIIAWYGMMQDAKLKINRDASNIEKKSSVYDWS